MQRGPVPGAGEWLQAYALGGALVVASTADRPYWISVRSALLRRVGVVWSQCNPGLLVTCGLTGCRRLAGKSGSSGLAG